VADAGTAVAGCDTAGFVAATVDGFEVDGDDFGAGCCAAITVTSPAHAIRVLRDIFPALVIRFVLTRTNGRGAKGYLGVLPNLRKEYTQSPLNIDGARRYDLL
jgi:hypothetical protein